ncbi:hypothetical protein L484_011615 [Morus notabilis]|uniref:Carbonyl reductase [NADPH] 1 n=1 Tax=Morus notabilis TaxID=981085 RepID=W9RAG8_9ROSA|nr:hypothetical protein L484_011615 [Morus notabilis]
MCGLLPVRDGSFGASDDARCGAFPMRLWHGGLDPDGTTLPLGISVFGFVVGSFVAALLRFDCLLHGAMARLLPLGPARCLGLFRLADVTLREQLGDVDSLSEELIDRTISNFLQQVEEGSWESGGWPQTFTDYSISKLAVNAYTRLMARILSNRPEGQKIYINCYCPGWVKTAMTGYAGNIPAEEGADTGVWLALLPDQAITGKLFAERREVSF